MVYLNDLSGNRLGKGLEVIRLESKTSSSLCSLIYSLCIWGHYCVPDTGDLVMIGRPSPCPHGVDILVGGDRQNASK